MYNFIARHMLASVLDFSRGTRTMKCLEELEKSQWWSRDKILELQNQRLRQLVRHAYDNVPYYRRIFDKRALKLSDIECSEDLVKLPVLTKKLIKDNFDNLTARGFPSKKIIRSATAGSTGEPLRFYSTRNDWRNWGNAAYLRAYGWSGYEIGDKRVDVSGRNPDHSALKVIRYRAIEFFERVVLLDVKEMSVGNMTLLTGKLDNLQPEFINGYPTAIYLLARFIQREGGPRLRPRAVITVSEQLYDYQRELFRKVFQCETYSHYDSWEMHAIATECSEHSGYHIAAENVIVEAVSDEGNPVLFGEEGKILVTNLHNYAMPFIRYDIGDVGAISDQVCSCGRGLPLLSKLSGRTTDVILTRSGRCIPAMALPWGFLADLDIEQLQIAQESYEKVVVKLVLDHELPQSRLDEITREIIRQWRPQLGENMDINIELVDQIPLTRAGKHKMVISNLPERNEQDYGLLT
ncbi:phenylacetate--CoA ligase family protein [Chloroflexota bacterium]